MLSCCLHPSYHLFHISKTFHASFSSLATSSPTVSSSFVLALFSPFRKLLLFLFFGNSPSHSLSHPCQDSWLPIQFHPPLFSLSRSHTGGGYANSSLSFLNWLIEARTLWRPCLWAAPSPSPLSHNLHSCSVCIERMRLLHWAIHSFIRSFTHSNNKVTV